VSETVDAFMDEYIRRYSKRDVEGVSAVGSVLGTEATG
jgi:hypothetical protein